MGLAGLNVLLVSILLDENLSDGSRLCFAVDQFKKNIGLPVSTFMLIISLSILSKSFNDFMFSNFRCLQMSIV